MYKRQLLEGPAFQAYARSVATSNYSFDQMFARSVRLESLFHILLESLEDGVIGINEKEMCIRDRFFFGDHGNAPPFCFSDAIYQIVTIESRFRANFFF